MKKLLPFAVLVLIVVGVAVYFSTTNTGTTSRIDQTDFAVKDTASIGKIFIADQKGRTVTLERKEAGVWMVNDTYRARPDAIRILLITFRNVYVQRPVPKEGIEQVNRVMAGSAKKAEIYDLDGKWLKTWYVGHGTMDKKGTYMLLETPEYGKSDAPFVMDKKGFLGVLDTRFFTNLEEWRSVRVLEYEDMNLSEIEVRYPSDPEASFRIEYGGGNDISLYAIDSDRPYQKFDTALVKDYMLNFKLASFENFKTGLTPEQEDSVKTGTPYQVIHIADPKRRRTIRLWAKAPPPGQYEMDGESLPEVDRERVFAAAEDNELALAQRLVWDPLRAPIQAFLVEEQP